MDLLAVIGMENVEGIDPNRPIEICGFTLGPEAAQEAIRLVEAAGPAKPIECFPKHNVSEPFFWSLSRRGAAVGEVFGFPKDRVVGLPTALEIAIVRAVAAVNEADLAKITAGDYLIALGKKSEVGKVCSVLTAIRSPSSGPSILLGRYASIDLTENADEQLTPVVIRCLRGSFEPMPLKFRFLELYRTMEARFLREIKDTLIQTFDAQPKAALDRATKSLGSELVQMMSLSDIKKPYFEMVWSAADSVRTTNQFAIALFRKISAHEELSRSPAKSGAALIYFLRCAVVHAGQKDMIYEAYPDGDALLALIMEHVEEVSLALAGIHVN